MNVSTVLTEIDRICDYIPFVSTISNMVNLIQKCICRHFPKSVAINPYWTYISQKSTCRSITLLLPVLGNIRIFICDYIKYTKDKATYKQTSESLKEKAEAEQKKTKLHYQSSILALLARQIACQQVTAKDMALASTENEKHLWQACRDNNIRLISTLLEQGTCPNFYHGGLTPLTTACRFGTSEAVELLLKAKAQVDIIDPCGNNPFIIACTKGDLKMVKLLIPHVKDINAPTPSGMTPLTAAWAHNHHHIVRFLISQGATQRRVAPQNQTNPTAPPRKDDPSALRLQLLELSLMHLLSFPETKAHKQKETRKNPDTIARSGMELLFGKIV